MEVLRPTTQGLHSISLYQPTDRTMKNKLFDNTIVSSMEQTLDFIGNILESSTEYLQQLGALGLQQKCHTN